MTFLTQLDVVNDMLACLSETPVNDLSTGHPLVPNAVRMIATANNREQTPGWWFNQEVSDLTPDITGTIYVPDGTIRVDPTRTSLNYVQRGRRLYQPYANSATDKYHFDFPVTCWLVTLIPFEDLPTSAQLLVSYSAQLDFMKSYDADQNKFAEVQQLKREARIVMNAEHIRAQDSNLLRNTMQYPATRPRGLYPDGFE